MEIIKQTYSTTFLSIINYSVIWTKYFCHINRNFNSDREKCMMEIIKLSSWAWPSLFLFFIFFAWQNWDLRSSKVCPRQMLHKQFLNYFQNIGFVAPGFEASKFLNKCEPPLWSIVNCRKLAIYDWLYRASTFMLKFESFKLWCYKTNILNICKKLFE